MKITILTMFPEAFGSFLAGSLVARATQKGALSLEIEDLKEYADGCFRKIDDSPYGGGAGCILRCEPVAAALDALRTPESRVIAFSPAGKRLAQADVRRWSQEIHLILLCGHYEGMDERIYEDVDEEISVGDYILSGGEIPAMAVVDAVVRLFPEALKEESSGEESFENGLLEYPQYTRPAEFRGRKVPEVLLSGNHEAIRRYRMEESRRRTAERRPDLWEKYKQNTGESK